MSSFLTINMYMRGIFGVLNHCEGGLFCSNTDHSYKNGCIYKCAEIYFHEHTTYNFCTFHIHFPMFFLPRIFVWTIRSSLSSVLFFLTSFFSIVILPLRPGFSTLGTWDTQQQKNCRKFYFNELLYYGLFELFVLSAIFTIGLLVLLKLPINPL